MHAVCRCTAGLLSPPVSHQLRHAICFPFASSLQHLLSLLQAVLDAALQREQLAGAPDEYADAVGAWDAAEGAAASNGGGAAAKQTMKVVLITGFESFNVDLYKKVGCSGAVAEAMWAGGFGGFNMAQPQNVLAYKHLGLCMLPPAIFTMCYVRAGGGCAGARLPRHFAARLFRPRPG